MPRRRIVAKREILPDPKYHNQTVAKFINHVMVSGKKAVAERIVYGALERIESGGPAIRWTCSKRRWTPSAPGRGEGPAGGRCHLPGAGRGAAVRRQALAMRWLVDSARKRGEKSMAARLAGEFMDAAEGRGSAVKKREDTHRMAEANKAFAHYR